MESSALDSMMIRDSRHQKLIQQLRREALEVRKCFRDFSFQSIAFGATVLGAAIGTMNQVPSVVYASLPAIVVFMIVGRIGVFKFSTANRLYGYELHLARLRYIAPEDAKKKNRLFDVSTITWEEAVRAWRIVQATVFQKIYNTPQLDPTARILSAMGLRFLNHFLPPAISQVLFLKSRNGQ